MPRIVAGSDDNAASCLTHTHSQFCGWCGCQAYIHNVKTHTNECSTDYILYHLTRDACISTYHDGIISMVLLFNKCGISCRKLDNVKWIERITSSTSDGAANT